jgi:hypothetical protein
MAHRPTWVHRWCYALGVALALLCLVFPVLLALHQPALAATGLQPVAQVRIPAAAQRYQGTLRREAHRVWGLGAPIATFAAQIHQESRWRADARSPVGAVGLTQFMPATAHWIGGLDPELATRAPMNPTWALRALVVYDHWLHQRVRTAADGCQRMAFALAAYNGGLGWVHKRQAQARAAGHDPGVCIGATCTINPGISPANQRENEHYARHILQHIEPAYRSWGAGSCGAVP